MKMMVIGRSGSGKDTFVGFLTKKYGLKQLISTTTRPKRFPGEDTHVFVSQEKANEMTDRIAETIINGYEYFATRKQFKDSDIYIIDPKGLKDLCRNVRNEKFFVVYLNTPFENRKERAIKRASNGEVEGEIFESRSISENKMFSDFEKDLINPHLNFKKKYPNVAVAYLIQNVGDIHDLEEKANKVYQEYCNAIMMRDVDESVRKEVV